MDNIDFVLFIILMFATSEFAIQMQMSTLSQWVKDTTGLKQPYSKKLQALCNPILYRRLFSWWFWLLSPLLLIIILAFNLHRFVSNLVDCSYCTSFWLATAVNYFVLNQTLPMAMLLAPIALIGVALLDKLHSY